MILQFKKYSEFYSISNLNKTHCVSLIRNILNKYKRIEWFKLLNTISSYIFLGDDIKKIEIAQNRLIGPIKFFLFHRRANLTLAQFIFDTNSSYFSYNKNQVNRNDIFKIYLLINEYLDLCETENSAGDNESIFFNTFKIVQTSFNGVDLRITQNLYQDYYDKFLETPRNREINKIISEKLGLEFETVSTFLRSFNSPEKKTIKNPLQLIEKIVGIDFNQIDEIWINRPIKCDIPYEYNFLENHAIIKYKDQYFVYDVFNLYYSLIRKIYDILFNQSVFDFPDFFGKNVIEPILLNRYKEQFSQLTILNVQSKKYEYSDFGILYKDIIFLFEIKSSFFKPNIRYTKDRSYFLKSFDGKYVTTSGINQQVNRIRDLDKKYDLFMESNSLKNKKYTFYTILIAFDESIQCLNCNWYLNKKYKEQIKGLNLSNISLSDQYAVLTVNEMELLRNKTDNINNQIEILLGYCNTSEKNIPMREFMEQRKENHGKQHL